MLEAGTVLGKKLWPVTGIADDVAAVRACARILAGETAREQHIDCGGGLVDDSWIGRVKAYAQAICPWHTGNVPVAQVKSEHVGIRGRLRLKELVQRQVGIPPSASRDSASQPL
jgi:hypothetical protein